MDEWCEEHNIFAKNWKQNDPLWIYSITDYWDQNVYDAAQDEIEKYNMLDTCRKRLEQIQGRHVSKEHAAEWFEAYGRQQLEEDYEPKQDSIDSLIIAGGQHYDVLTFALFQTAQHLFPDANSMCVTVTRGANEEYPVVLIPDQKLVFDLLGYYFKTREGVNTLLPDKKYVCALQSVLLDSDSDDWFDTDDYL